MNDLIVNSVTFFVLIGGGAWFIFLARTSPLTQSTGGLVAPGWSGWLAEQLQGNFGDRGEAFFARLARLCVLCVKYGVVAWSLLNPRLATLNFWTLLWVLLLVLEVMYKAVLFLRPMRWENTSLKLDGEHFWLIHLVLLATVEMHLVGNKPWGLVSLVVFYAFLTGQSRPSLLGALEDCVSFALSLVIVFDLLGFSLGGLIDFSILLTVGLVVRAIVRIVVGRSWIQRRFWWIAQFCLMTSLIIKSLEVLGVLAIINP